MHGAMTLLAHKLTDLAGEIAAKLEVIGEAGELGQQLKELNDVAGQLLDKARPLIFEPDPPAAAAEPSRDTS
jgi:hypothetical protein